jgi:hypothetical protein
MRIWQNGRKSSISYDREFGKKYDGNLVLYKRAQYPSVYLISTFKPLPVLLLKTNSIWINNSKPLHYALSK